jgi:hypothetical protein
MCRVVTTSPFAFFTRFIGVGRVAGGRFDGQSFTFGYHDSYEGHLTSPFSPPI